MPAGDPAVLAEAARELSRGRRVALCTVVEKVGSGPRDPGAKLAVLEDGVFGTLGGGEFERLVVEAAREALQDGRPRLLRFSFTESGSPGAIDTGHLCGGESTVFIDVLVPDPRLFLVGSGHVALQVHRVAQVLGWRSVVVDDHPETATPARFPGAELRVGDPVEGLARDPPGPEDLLFLAHGEPDVEYRILRFLCGLERLPRYVGLLGSKTKGGKLLARLRDEGLDFSRLKGVLRVPSGLDLGSDTPGEVAVSVVAEMLAVVKGVTPPGSMSMADGMIEALERGSD